MAQGEDKMIKKKSVELDKANKKYDADEFWKSFVEN